MVKIRLCRTNFSEPILNTSVKNPQYLNPPKVYAQTPVGWRSCLVSRSDGRGNRPSRLFQYADVPEPAADWLLALAGASRAADLLCHEPGHAGRCRQWPILHVVAIRQYHQLF